jgi:hypothetical protein
MRRLAGVLLIFASFAFSVPGARADLTLSVSAESADLTHLQVGQTVRFDVSLSGLTSGNQLDYLAGTVLFDDTLLGSGKNVTARAIVPDLTGFVSATFAGAAAAFYDAVFVAVSGTPISANGVFYSFDVVAHKPRSGTMGLDPSSLAASDGKNNPITLGCGPDISYTILAPHIVAPAATYTVCSGVNHCGAGEFRGHDDVSVPLGAPGIDPSLAG